MACKQPSPSDENYLFIGGMLRDDLISEIDALDWDNKERAEKVRQALQIAAPYRTGYLVDVHDWSWEDDDFLRMNLDSVHEDMGHSAMSRGMDFHDSPIARQIRALREKL